jgi:LmbE family N-acetylglucosaminyl deacetylase
LAQPLGWLSTLLSSVLALAAPVVAQPSNSPPPDDRYKVDILVMVAHPDDETEVSGYLARAIFDQHKRVAVIFGTRGNGGGNAAGIEQSAALGAEREIEARQALASFGVDKVWFLNGPDTPGQDVLRSLETWNHGASLDQTVRLIRLTRPEVIMTWLPLYVAGENHGDHQAAGVLATEAFDLAGNPAAFGEQVAAPRDPNGIGNLTEGLRPWQVKKLYYFTDAAHTDFQGGHGPRYSNEETSPAKHVPYYRLAAEEMAYHLTQDDTGQMAKKAIAGGDFTYFRQPVLLFLGKSLVAAQITGDVLEGINQEPITYAAPPAYQPEKRSGLSFELGGSWFFYRQFWNAHGLDATLSPLLPRPEISLNPGERAFLPILLHNDTDKDAQIKLTISVPDGWTEVSGTGDFLVRPHDTFATYISARSPAKQSKAAGKISLTANAGGVPVGSLDVKAFLLPGSLPQ